MALGLLGTGPALRQIKGPLATIAAGHSVEGSDIQWRNYCRWRRAIAGDGEQQQVSNGSWRALEQSLQVEGGLRFHR